MFENTKDLCRKGGEQLGELTYGEKAVGLPAAVLAVSVCPPLGAVAAAPAVVSLGLDLLKLPFQLGGKVAAAVARRRERKRKETAEKEWRRRVENAEAQERAAEAARPAPPTLAQRVAAARKRYEETLGVLAASGLEPDMLTEMINETTEEYLDQLAAIRRSA